MKTKEEFKQFIACLYADDLESIARSDADTAAQVRPFDPQLAAMCQTLADTKVAIYRHIKAKRER